MRFVKTPLTCQCKTGDKKAEEFQISLLLLVVFKRHRGSEGVKSLMWPLRNHLLTHELIKQERRSTDRHVNGWN